MGKFSSGGNVAIPPPEFRAEYAQETERMTCPIRRLLCLAGYAGAWLGFAAATGHAQPAGQPAAGGNLLVSWRVSSQGNAVERSGGLRQGGVTVDSRGGVRVEGQAQAGQHSVQTRRDTVQAVQVLNGGEARLFMGRSVPHTSWQLAWRAPADAGGAPQAWAVSQTQWVDLGQGLTVRPRWPGGRAPVTVTLQAQAREAAGPHGGAGGVALGGALEPDGQIRRTEVASTLQVPLGEWVVVARRGQDSDTRQSGTWSTRAIGDAQDEVLEIRVSAP
jgi:hypothetical protein